jgi:hypothetical protein
MHYVADYLQRFLETIFMQKRFGAYLGHGSCCPAHRSLHQGSEETPRLSRLIGNLGMSTGGEFGLRERSPSVIPVLFGPA